MNLNIDPEWLRRMADAENENGGIVSVGGLVTRVVLAERLAAAVNAGNGPRAFEETARGMYDALVNMGVCLRDVGCVVIPAIAAQLEMAYRAGQADYRNAPIPTAEKPPLSAAVRINICEVCDWPLAPPHGYGCVPGNCAYRPKDDTPEFFRIAERRRQLAAAKTPPG